MPRERLAFGAAIAVNPALGSLYAWSIFLEPMEAALALPRAGLSIVFSVAVVFFTAGMVLGPALYRLAPTPVLAALLALLCAAGLAATAQASSLAAVVLGYGVLFGSGSGLGYSVMLQAVNLALPRRSGLANGIGIGLFAGGSVLFAQLFGWSVAAHGVAWTLWAMAALFVAAAAAAALFLHLSRISLRDAGRLRADTGGVAGRRLFRPIWAGFLLGAGSGLMCISQAAAMVTAYGGSVALAVFGTTMVAAGNCAGRLAGGALSDLLPTRTVVVGAHALAAIGLAALVAAPAAGVAVAAIAMVGLSYGLQSAAYPSALAIHYGAENYGRMMGRLMTAWGIAGLSAPIVAGALYDARGSYAMAVWLAAGAAALAILVSLRLPGRSPAARPA